MTPTPPASDKMPSTPLIRMKAAIRELELLSKEIESYAQPATLVATVQRGESELQTLAGSLLWQRAIIDENFGFVDPGFNLMLFLYASGADAAPSTGACCTAARVPRTTALRWITVLEHKGLVRSMGDPEDGRKTSVVLSEAGRRTMRACLAAIADAPVGGVTHP